MANPIPLESISFDKESLEIEKGATETLTLTLTPADTTDEVICSVSPEDALKITKNGITISVEALKEGTCVIYAKVKDNDDKIKTCTVTVKAPQSSKVPVTNVTVSPSEKSLTVNETVELTASVLPDDATEKTVTWKSNDTSIATVDSTGKVTAVKVGNTKIIATADGKTGECTISVLSAPVQATDITISKTTLSIEKGRSETLTYTITPNNATSTVEWKSSDSSVATVTNGVVYGQAVGTADITVKANGHESTCKVTVTEPAATAVPVDSVTLNNSTLSLKVGSDSTLTATIAPTNATDKTIRWSSSDESVATVDDTGKVSALKQGGTTITATAGSKSATCVVTVTNVEIPVKEISLNKTTTTLEVGQTETLTETVLPDNATNAAVTWTTSDSSIATVANGLITAIKVGNATITAKAGGEEATCSVSVVGKPTTYSVKYLFENIDDNNYGEDSSKKPSETGIASTVGAGTNITPPTIDGFANPTFNNITLKEDATQNVVEVKYARKIITITLILDNEQPNQTIEDKYGATVTPPANPTKEGWIFDRWSPALPTEFESNKTCTAQWTNNIAATGITLDKTTLSLHYDETATLKPTLSPADSVKPITWTSSNEDYAKVENGVVTVKCADLDSTVTVTITATVQQDGEEIKTTCNLTIKELGAYKELPDSEPGSVVTGGEYVEFGTFPQTLLEDNSIISASATTKKVGGETYYKGTDGWYYATIEGTGKYFKVEPIKWRVLTSDGNKKMLLADEILNSGIAYYYWVDESTPTNGGTAASIYKYSNIRAYLTSGSPLINETDSLEGKNQNWKNEGFIDTAFSSTQQIKILKTTVDNSKDSTTDSSASIAKCDKDTLTDGTKYNYDSTEDKIFLLSAFEVTNSNDYKFPNKCTAVGDSPNTAKGKEQDHRKRSPTDYAKAKGCEEQSENTKTALWWLRSPSQSAQGDARCIKNDRKVGQNNTKLENIGIVPALWYDPDKTAE